MRSCTRRLVVLGIASLLLSGLVALRADARGGHAHHPNHGKHHAAKAHHPRHGHPVRNGRHLARNLGPRGRWAGRPGWWGIGGHGWLWNNWAAWQPRVLPSVAWYLDAPGSYYTRLTTDPWTTLFGTTTTVPVAQTTRP